MQRKKIWLLLVLLILILIILLQVLLFGPSSSFHMSFFLTVHFSLFLYFQHSVIIVVLSDVKL